MQIPSPTHLPTVPSLLPTVIGAKTMERQASLAWPGLGTDKAARARARAVPERSFIISPKDVATTCGHIVVWAGSNVKHIIFVFTYNKYKCMMHF